MPQLEQVEFFVSQLFWLGVFFVILFTVLTYATLPKIRAFLNQRDDFVKSHISKQDELIKKAESIIENYETKLNEAKNEASKLISDAKDKALQDSESLIKSAEEKIQREIKITEERTADLDNKINELLSSAKIQSDSLSKSIVEKTKQSILSKEKNSLERIKQIENSAIQIIKNQASNKLNMLISNYLKNLSDKDKSSILSKSISDFKSLN